ncbi:MAG: hypothetical protein PSV16_04105 [Flavobacterium sp.]|nr:hypothetical protein [Flavobacterium sp.]
MSKTVLNKLPEITIAFWITKICATTLGETGGDLLAQTLQLGYLLSSIIFLSLFFLAFFIQICSKKYSPITYWLVIITTSTAGTTISDFMDRTLGLGYAKGSLILISMLICILLVWKATEKSLSVTAIKSVRSESFYWIAILVSNTLGTALGDFLADNSGLGFSGGAILIGTLLLLITLAHFFTKISSILLFWLAFVLTRPFGATFGDFLTKPIDKGGLDFGTSISSLCLCIIMFVLVFKEFKKINHK